MKNNKIVEIVLSGSTLLSVENISSNTIIDFRFDFVSSDLSKMNEYIIILPVLIYNEKIIVDFKDKIDLLNKYIKDNYVFRIWSSHYDPNSYMLLLYICNYLRNKKVDIIVLFSDDYNKDYYSCGAMSSKELIELTNHEHHLSQKEISFFSDQWDRLNKNNNVIRIIDRNSGEIISVDYNYFDNEIVNIISNKKIKINELLYIISSKYHINETIFKYIVNQLII